MQQLILNTICPEWTTCNNLGGKPANSSWRETAMPCLSAICCWSSRSVLSADRWLNVIWPLGPLILTLQDIQRVTVLDENGSEHWQLPVMCRNSVCCGLPLSHTQLPADRTAKNDRCLEQPAPSSATALFPQIVIIKQCHVRDPSFNNAVFCKSRSCPLGLC